MWLSSRVVLVVCCLIIGLVLVFPVLMHPFSMVPATAFSDGHLIALSLGARQFPFVLSTSQFGFPDAVSFRPLLWPALPVVWLLGPVATFNLLYLTAPLLNGLGGWALARRLGLQGVGPLTAGGLLAWNTWVFTVLANGQLEQSFLGGMAFLWALVLWAEDSYRRLLVPGLFAVAFALATPHLAMLGVAGAMLLVLVRRKGFLILPGLALALYLGALYHSPAIRGASSMFSPKGRATGVVAPYQFEAASLQELLIWPSGAKGVFLPVIHTSWLGWVTVGAAGIGGWFLYKQSRSLFVWLLVLAGGFVLCSLGDSVVVGGSAFTTPVGYLSGLSSAFARSGNAYRFAAGAVVALSMLAAAAGQSRWGLLILALAWGEVGLVRSRGIPLAVQKSPFEEYALQIQGSTPVLDLPLLSNQCPTAAYHYGAQAVVSGRPVFHTLRLGKEAYGRAGMPLEKLGLLLASESCVGELPGVLGAMGIGVVVLHQDVRCGLDEVAVRCLEEVFGEAVVEEGHRWWEMGG